MQTPAYDQTDFRARNDDGSETGATWQASTNTDWSQYYQDPLRIRLAVAEVNGEKDNNRQFQLQYSHNSGTWTNVTTSSSVVQATTSSNFADGDNTTQQISSGTFLAGRMSEDGIAGDNSAISFNGGDTTELEWMLSVVNADVSDGDTVSLRAVFGDGTVFGTYTNTPTATINTSQVISTAPATTTSTAISPTASEVTTIGGTTNLNGSAVSGARVFVVDTTNDTIVADTTSDGSGNWTASVPTGNTYHVCAQYDDGSGNQYNEYSKPFMVT